jgi:sec-independent protein translocase protein TatC
MAPNEHNPSGVGRIGTKAAEMSFGEHLEELRKHLILALLGLVPIFFLGMYLAKDILDFLIAPAQQQLLAQGQAGQLQATGAAEVFGTWVRISLIFTVLVGGPWMVFQLWRFVSPGLYAHEKRFAILLIPFSVALTIVSALFLYYVMWPIALHFLIGFGVSVAPLEAPVALPPEGTIFPFVPILASDPPAPMLGHAWINSTLNELRICVAAGPPPVVKSTPLTTASGIVQQYRVSEYVGLILSMALAFAGGFQTPVVVLLLGWVGLIDTVWLRKQRKYALFVAIIAAAILTPTGDPLTLSLLFVPLYLLYELGVFLLRFLPASRVARGFGREPDGDADA